MFLYFNLNQFEFTFTPVFGNISSFSSPHTFIYKPKFSTVLKLTSDVDVTIGILETTLDEHVKSFFPILIEYANLAAPVPIGAHRNTFVVRTARIESR